MNTALQKIQTEAVNEIPLLPAKTGSIELYFISLNSPLLEEIRFTYPPNGEIKRVVWASRSEEEQSGGTFRWTIAVRALTLLLLRSVASAQRHSEPYQLVGGAGSLAAALDYAISKQPRWLQETFGMGGNGISYARDLFHRINSERKRGGDVSLQLRQNLPLDAIHIYSAGVRVDSAEKLESAAAAIEDSEKLLFTRRERVRSTISIVDRNTTASAVLPKDPSA